MATFTFNNKAYNYSYYKCKLLHCPFKHCPADMLGRLGGLFSIHRCYRHGLLKCVIGKTCDDSYVETMETLDKVQWSWTDLLERGIIQIKLLDKFQRVVIELGGVKTETKEVVKNVKKN